MSARVRKACVECGSVGRPLVCSMCGFGYCRDCLRDHGACNNPGVAAEVAPDDSDFPDMHGFSGLIGWVGEDGLARVTLVGVTGARLSGVRVRPPDR